MKKFLESHNSYKHKHAHKKKKKKTTLVCVCVYVERGCVCSIIVWRKKRKRLWRELREVFGPVFFVPPLGR